MDKKKGFKLEIPVRGRSVGESQSLWNYSLSPGWSPQECEILRLCIMKFGCGSWSTIQKTDYLVGKTVNQMYMQTQRMIGQQSLAEFLGIRFDALQVNEDNQKKKNVIRKQGLIINTESNPTKKTVEAKKMDNEKRYGIKKGEKVPNVSEYVKKLKSDMETQKINDCSPEMMHTYMSLDEKLVLQEKLNRKLIVIEDLLQEKPLKKKQKR